MQASNSMNSAWVQRIVIVAAIGVLLVAAAISGNHLSDRTGRASLLASASVPPPLDRVRPPKIGPSGGTRGASLLASASVPPPLDRVRPPKIGPGGDKLV